MEYLSSAISVLIGLIITAVFNGIINLPKKKKAEETKKQEEDAKKEDELKKIEKYNEDFEQLIQLQPMFL